MSCKWFLVVCLKIMFLRITLCEQNLSTIKVVSVQNSIEETTTKRVGVVKTAYIPKENTTIKIEIVKKVCPENIGRIPFFSLPCESSDNCAILGPDLVCCKFRCIKGVDPPTPEAKHQPLFFGLIGRVCPAEPLAELLEIKECTSDENCGSRICCPEKYVKANIGKSYCRIAAPNFDRMPFAKQLFQPVQTFVSFMQCSPPPPPVLDIFPKQSKRPIDCFPNLCCQEGAKKFCRPPKRSFLTLMAGVARRFGSSDFAKRVIERISN